MTSPGAEPYERLAAIIELELQLVGEGRLDELAPLAAAHDELIASLPSLPAAAAAPALVRCSMLAQRLRIELLRACETVLQGVSRVERAQRTAAGYAPVPPAPRIRARA